MQNPSKHLTQYGKNKMIPNIGQLLLVCGIALGGVGLIVWVLLKIPEQSPENGKDDRFDKD